MKRSLAALVISLAALLGFAPALAQDAPPQALQTIMEEELSPERMELATKLLQLSGTSRVFDQILPGIAEQAKNYFIRANPQMQLGIISVVDKVALEMVSRRPELDQYFARVWASGFSDDEMQELIDFYETDLGKKFAIAFPQVLAVQMGAAQEWGKSVSAELSQRVQEELRAAMAAEQEALQSDIAGPANTPPTEEPAPQ
jgi:hypothetical protein